MIGLFLAVPLIIYGTIAPGSEEWLSSPALVTHYMPLQGGINCDLDCFTLADGGGWTEDDYGRVAACPARMFGRRIRLYFPDGTAPVLHCRDRGGAIGWRWNNYYGRYVVHIDILSESVGRWNYYLVYWEFVP